MVEDTGRALLRDLRAEFTGPMVHRGHRDYDDARRVWNGMVDRRPAVIARCTGTADVVAAVRAAARHRPPVSIRAGGHQVAGSAVCDDGLVIDLSLFKGVFIDPLAGTVRIRPGVTWAELDRATQLFGQVVPGGEVPATGVAGVTLGGGIGLLARAYGLSCDSLHAIEVVTADGAVRVAGSDAEPDLLWAARGAGRGLGVVTALTFDLHPLGPSVATVQVFYPYDRAESLIRTWREVVAAAPYQVSPQLVLRDLPPAPAVPPDLHGVRVVGVGAVYAGPPAAAHDVLAPLRRLATPVLDLSGVVPYLRPAPRVPEHRRAYMKSHYLDALSDDAIRALLTHAERRTGPDSAVVLRSLGGAVADTDRGAYPHRAAAFNLNVHATWDDPAHDDTVLDWCESTWAGLAPYANGGIYLNFAGLDADLAGDRYRAVYGDSADRLEKVRRHYDPDGVFATAAMRP